MAEHDYARLAAACHCGKPTRLLPGRGRPPTTCEDHRRKPNTQPAEKQCPACRGFFTPSAKVGQKQSYCSKLCAVRSSRGNKPRQMWQLCCSVCNAGFESISESAIYCSNRCKMVAWKRANPGRKPAKKTQRIQLLCAYFSGYCGVCGCAVGGRSVKRSCEECAKNARLQAGREAIYAVNIAKHRSQGKVIQCAGCKADFCPLYGTKERSACHVCKPTVLKERQRAAKDRRDKRIKSGERETVWSSKVFDRDGWRCQLCGVETPKSLRGTYAHNAPELDHIVPVSMGGSHTYKNTQCLCRSCNGWKGARTMDEVLAALAA